MCSCILLVKLQSRLRCKHDLGDECPLDLQFEQDAVDLIEGLKMHQANFISLVENQYGPVSYLPAEYPARTGGVDEG